MLPTLEPTALEQDLNDALSQYADTTLHRHTNETHDQEQYKDKKITDLFSSKKRISKARRFKNPGMTTPIFNIMRNEKGWKCLRNECACQALAESLVGTEYAVDSCNGAYATTAQVNRTNTADHFCLFCDYFHPKHYRIRCHMRSRHYFTGHDMTTRWACAKRLDPRTFGESAHSVHRKYQGDTGGSRASTPTLRDTRNDNAFNILQDKGDLCMLDGFATRWPPA